MSISLSAVCAVQFGLRFSSFMCFGVLSNIRDFFDEFMVNYRTMITIGKFINSQTFVFRSNQFRRTEAERFTDPRINSDDQYKTNTTSQTL